jgi:hypothetical protein
MKKKYKQKDKKRKKKEEEVMEEMEGAEAAAYSNLFIFRLKGEKEDMIKSESRKGESDCRGRKEPGIEIDR